MKIINCKLLLVILMFCALLSGTSHSFAQVGFRMGIADIGYQPSLDIGTRASLRSLSSLFKRVPKAHYYRVAWKFRIRGKLVKMQTDFGGHLFLTQQSGPKKSSKYIWERWAPVNKKAIQTVAAKNGTLSDLKKFGAKKSTTP